MKKAADDGCDDDVESEIDLRPGQEDMEWQLGQSELALDVVVAQETEKRGLYTAERLQHRHPKLYKACCNMIGLAATKTIARILSLDIRTVNAVVARMEAEGSIPPLKERNLKQLRAVITIGLEELFADVIAGTRKLSALDLGILMDKEQLLSGGATSRVEVIESPQAVEARERLERLRRMASGMVLEGEVLPQRAPALLPGETAVLPVQTNSDLAASGCTRDTESSDSDTQHVERQ